jgi:hypothetical protein
MSSHRAWFGAAVCLAVAMQVVADDVVVARNVNLRPDPSTSHRPLRLIKPDETLTLLEPGPTNGYYHVRTAGSEEGWVRAANVRVRVVPARPRGTPAVATPAQPIRTEAPPARRTPAFFPLATGTIIPVTAAILGGAAALFGAAILVRRQVRRARAERERLAAEDEARRQAGARELESLSRWTDRKNWPNLNREVFGVILGEAETCVALSRGVAYIELRKRTHYEGGSAGFSVRIMRGVSLRSGRFAGRPVTTVTPEVSDYGTLFVTDRRILFAGSREILEIPLKKLADARAGAGKLELLVANRPNPLEFELSEAYRAPVIAGAAKLMAGAAQAGPRR